MLIINYSSCFCVFAGRSRPSSRPRWRVPPTRLRRARSAPRSTSARMRSRYAHTQHNNFVPYIAFKTLTFVVFVAYATLPIVNAQHEIDRECRFQNPPPPTLCCITSQLTFCCVCIRRQAARDAPFAWRQLREYNASTTALPLAPTYIHTQSNMQLFCVLRIFLRNERALAQGQDRIGHVRNSGTPSLSGRVVYGIIKG